MASEICSFSLVHFSISEIIIFPFFWLCVTLPSSWYDDWLNRRHLEYGRSEVPKLSNLKSWMHSLNFSVICCFQSPYLFPPLGISSFERYASVGWTSFRWDLGLNLMFAAQRLRSINRLYKSRPTDRGPCIYLCRCHEEQPTLVRTYQYFHAVLSVIHVVLVSCVHDDFRMIFTIFFVPSYCLWRSETNDFLPDRRTTSLVPTQRLVQSEQVLDVGPKTNGKLVPSDVIP